MSHLEGACLARIPWPCAHCVTSGKSSGEKFAVTGLDILLFLRDVCATRRGRKVEKECKTFRYVRFRGKVPILVDDGAYYFINQLLCVLSDGSVLDRLKVQFPGGKVGTGVRNAWLSSGSGRRPWGARKDAQANVPVLISVPSRSRMTCVTIGCMRCFCTPATLRPWIDCGQHATLVTALYPRKYFVVLVVSILVRIRTPRASFSLKLRESRDAVLSTDLICF